MKSLKRIMILAACLGCLGIWYNSTKAVERFPMYDLENVTKNCFLCGTNERSLLSYYKGQKNIGIINLHTGDLSFVEINRYDDTGTYNMHASDSMTITTNSFDDGFTTSVTPNTKRGYANVSVSFKEQHIDDKRMRQYFCSDCIKDIMKKNWGDDPYSVGVIDFATLEVRFLEESVKAFLFGDYYISCSYQKKPFNSGRVKAELLVFYCPERY